MPPLVRVELTGQLNGAGALGPKRHLQSAKCAAQKAIVKAHVVGDKQMTVESCQQIASDVFEKRCIRDHVVVNAGERTDLQGDFSPRIEQRGPRVALAIGLHTDHGNFGDAMKPRTSAGGFQVHEGCRQRCMQHYLNRTDSGIGHRTGSRRLILTPRIDPAPDKTGTHAKLFRRILFFEHALKHSFAMTVNHGIAQFAVSRNAYVAKVVIAQCFVERR